MNRLPLHQKNLTAAGISALIVVVLFVSLGAKPRMQSSPNYEYKVLNQTKLSYEELMRAQQYQTKLIHEAVMQAQQQAQQEAPQNHMQIVDMFSQISSTMLDSQAKKIEDTLNKLGSEGWELAGITEALYILKRPVK